MATGNGGSMALPLSGPARRGLAIGRQGLRNHNRCRGNGSNRRHRGLVRAIATGPGTGAPHLGGPLPAAAHVASVPPSGHLHGPRVVVESVPARGDPGGIFGNTQRTRAVYRTGHGILEGLAVILPCVASHQSHPLRTNAAAAGTAADPTRGADAAAKTVDRVAPARLTGVTASAPATAAWWQRQDCRATGSSHA